MGNEIKKDLHGLVDKVYDELLVMTQKAIDEKVGGGTDTMDLLGQTVNVGDYVVGATDAWNAKMVVYHVHKTSVKSVYCTLVKSKAKKKKEFIVRTTSVVKVEDQSVLYYKLSIR